MGACSCIMRELKIVNTTDVIASVDLMSGRDKNFSMDYTNSKLEALLHD